MSRSFWERFRRHRSANVPELFIVEDNRLEQERLRDCLAEDYTLRFAGSLEEARAGLAVAKPDLVLLDITLPDGDAFSLVSLLSPDGGEPEVPVIFLTSRSDPQDKVLAFSLGAEDYLEKPFEAMELRARIERRVSREHKRKPLVRGPLSLDTTRFQASLEDDGPLDLTPNEFRILFALAEHPERERTREQLLAALWGDIVVTPRTIDTHIYTIRQKLGEHRDLIQTIPKVGYRFRETS